MDIKSKILLWVIICASVFSLLLTVYNTLIKENYGVVDTQETSE